MSLVINIENSKFLIGLQKKPKAAHNSRQNNQEVLHDSTQLQPAISRVSATPFARR
jgi:hypothetical protein